MILRLASPAKAPCRLSAIVQRKGCILLSVMSLLLMGGCQSGWETPPDLGQSVNEAIQAQLVNPSAPVGNAAAPRGMDGPAAKYTIDNYEKSFKDPRMNRSNLGSVSGQTSSSNSSAGSATPSTPR